MARKTKTIEISGINIVTQPHSPQQYIELIRSIVNQAISVRGHEHLMLAGIRPHLNHDYLTGIEGELIKFSDIGHQTQWINLTTRNIAEPEDIPTIPDNLRPNGALFPFIFYPNNHKLLYISKSYNSNTKKNDILSPNLVKRFLDKAFLNITIQHEFNSIETTVIPQKNALETIFKLHQLKKLCLQITPPNPDDFDFEEEMLNRLESTNTDRLKIEYISKGEPLEPDEQLKNEAKVAAHNGFVEGIGKDNEGKTIKLSTKKIPMEEKITVDNERIAEIEALRKFRLDC